MSNCNKTVCRACLGPNSRMYDLRDSPLRGIFEKITGAELISGDRSALCYLCTAQLQTYARFQDMVRQADSESKQVLSIDVKCPRLSSLRITSYSTTELACLSLTTQAAAPGPSHGPPAHSTGTVSVKREPVDVEVKQEFEDVIKVYPSEDEELNMAAAQSAPSSDQCFNPKTTLYHCSFCLKEINNLEELTRHERSHDIEICDICGAKYPRRNRNNHIRKHTKPFKCHICQKSFSEQSTVNKHIASHSDIKSFVCRICRKGFTHKSFLIVHERSHTGEKPYTCQLCAKTFTQIAHLISHRHTHDKKKPPYTNSKYICDICSSTFNHRSSLIKHMNLHVRVRSYACKVCSKVFTRSDTLACHMRCHTGEKPFKCAVCGERYAAKGNYRKHLKSHQ